MGFGVLVGFGVGVFFGLGVGVFFGTPVGGGDGLGVGLAVGTCVTRGVGVGTGAKLPLAKGTAPEVQVLPPQPHSNAATQSTLKPACCGFIA